MLVGLADAGVEFGIESVAICPKTQGFPGCAGSLGNVNILVQLTDRPQHLGLLRSELGRFFLRIAVCPLPCCCGFVYLFFSLLLRGFARGQLFKLLVNSFNGVGQFLNVFCRLSLLKPLLQFFFAAQQNRICTRANVALRTPRRIDDADAARLAAFFLFVARQFSAIQRQFIGHHLAGGQCLGCGVVKDIHPQQFGDFFLGL